MATVRLNSTLRDAAGVKTVDLATAPDATVADVVGELLVSLPALAPEILDGAGELRGNIVIFRNGRNIRLLNDLQTPVSPDQTLDFFPKIGAYRVFGG